MGAERAVIIKGGDLSLREEFTAGGAITPGQLMEINSSDAVVVHNSADEDQYALFALPDESQGKDIDDAYATGERVQAYWARRGDIVNALLADGQTAVIGSFLTSNGDGDLKVHVTDDSSSPIFPNQIVGVARAALDLSDSSGADPSSRRINTQII